jgi:nucleoid-associated protein YgaU
MDVAYRRMGYDYEYEDAGAGYDARILWGRMAVYGVAFVLVFLVGMWWGGRGDVDEDQIVELQSQVETLEAENQELRDTVDALSAGQTDEPEPATNEDEAADEPDGADQPADEPEEAPEAAQEPQPETYVVQSGDTLRGIAADVYGDPDEWERIAEANGLTRETVLTVGQELIIPPADSEGGGG